VSVGPLRDSRYTRSVSWRHRITVALLFVLAAGPVGGTLCAASCDVRESPAMVQHHAAHCEELTDSASVLRMSGTSQHDCAGHQALGVAATIVLRADLNWCSLPSADVSCDCLPSFVRGVVAALAYTSPPGAAPPTTTPLILRV